MPRFAANLHWLFTEHPFLDRFAAARRAGFRAVEFPSPYEHPPEVVAARAREAGVECILFNLPSGDRAKGDFGIACRPAREAEFREGVARAIAYAEALGCTRVNCIAGKAEAGDDAARLRAVLVANLDFAARELAKASIELVVEPINTHDVPGFFMPTSPEAAAIIAEVGSQNLGLQCDIYHTAMMGDDPADILQRLFPVIRHVQFADAPGRGEPGSGKIDLAALFRLLDRLAYRGWVSAEYRPSVKTEETLSWLRATA